MTRHRLGVAALVLLLAPPALPGAPRRGPIADFWAQVKRSWAQKIPGLRTGSGQTPEWVSLVYGGEGDVDAMDALLEREMRRWTEQQQRQWVRSMFWRRRYGAIDPDSFYGSRALRKNLVVMGTPSDNPLIATMTGGTPFRLQEGRVQVGRRVYEGGSLVLVFVRPNPFEPSAYALVLAAASRDALLELGRLPFGSTDYVLFRGAGPVEAGFFDWTDPAGIRLGPRREIFPDHDGWEAWTQGEATLRVPPGFLAETEARRLVDRRSASLSRAVARLGLDARPAVEEYLYPSLEEKVLHTGQGGPLSVDLAAGAVHRVAGLPGEATWPGAMVALWRSWGATDLRGLLHGLALLADPEPEGIPLDAWAARLLRRGGLPGMDEIMACAPGPGLRGPEPLGILALGSFLAHLEQAHGLEALARFYRVARAGNLRREFRREFGLSVARAERAWKEALQPPPSPPSAAPPRPPAPGALARLVQGEELFRQRRDGEAAEALRGALAIQADLPRARLLLARLAFRGGRDEEAGREAAEALRLAGTDAEVTSWAHVTLGRAHAVRGEIAAARLELEDPSLADGPEAPRLLAELWLENLGLSPGRRAAARQLTRQVEIDLMRSDWDAAEERVLRILAADPGDAGAHHLLARVRLEKFEYWHDFARLYNELFPTATRLDELQYFYLVQSAERESWRGANLQAGRMGILDQGTPGEPGGFGPADLLPATRAPEAGFVSDAGRAFLEGRARYLAGDYPRAAALLESSLVMEFPVSDARAWALLLLGRAEAALGRREAAERHLREAWQTTRRREIRDEISRSLEELERKANP